jgi:hypothetical protein
MLICQEPDQVAWRKVQAHMSVLERAQTQDVGVVWDWPVGLPPARADDPTLPAHSNG